jgi:flagellar motor switch protein FliN
MPVLHAEIPQTTSSAAPDEKQSEAELQRILRLEVPLIVKLAERKVPLAEVLRFGLGGIVEFSKSSDEPLELLVNNKVIALGETVKVGENFGLRITRIGDIREVIESLGG